MEAERSGRLTRRTAVLGVGGALLLAGCTPRAVSPRPTGSTPTPAPTPSPSSTPGWSSLRSALRGLLVLPSDSGYAAAARVENPRFDGARPLAIVRVQGEDDVRSCLDFARRRGIPVAIRSGGHSYAGWSAGGAAGTDVPPSLVISTAALRSIRIEGARATIGPGAPLIRVYTALAGAGRAIGGGTCPTVGIGGLTLGGGIGVLGRAFGLTCDQLVGATVVTADGTVQQVDADHRPDLLWAARGGGTGTIGVVTSLTFETRPAPAVTRFVLPIPFDAAAEAVAAWQEFAPHADDRLWTSLHLSVRAGTPAAFVAGAWIGEAGALAGVLQPLRRRASGAFGALDAVREDYGTAMRAYAGCARIPVPACTTGPGGALAREAEAATSSVAYAALPAKAIGTLIERVRSVGEVPGLREGAVLLDALGGAIGRVAPDATAFPHRAALYTAQYTATFATGADPAPFDRAVRASRAAMTPAFGDHAYANYVDPSLADPGRAYFGANLDRLRTVLAGVDPDRVFRQPHFV